MTRNEFLKMAGTSAALVVINTALVPTAIAAEPIGTVLSAKKSVNTGTAVSSATFELVPISRQTFWGDSGSCTLDYLSEGYIQWTINLNGILLNIIDTAGIRDTEDVVEKIGVERAKKYLNNADLVIYVVDTSTALDENDHEIMELLKDRHAIV